MAIDDGANVSARDRTFSSGAVEVPVELTEPSRGRAVALAEIVILLVTLEWVLWTDHRTVFSRPARTAGIAIMVVVVLTLLYRQRPGLAELGVAPRSWWAGVGLLAAFTALAMLACASIGAWWGTIGNVEHFGRWIVRNWYMEGVQQVLLQVILVPRLNAMLGRRGVAVSALAAVIFGLLHAPNLVLMALTAAGAFAWCEWFRRHRNLPALWASHLALAATVLYCLNGPALRKLRVGIGYLMYSGS